MQITRSDLLRLCPNASAGILDGILQYGPGMLPRYGITTPLRWAHFIAQTAHESAGLSRTTENLSYSAEALLRVWPRHFDAMDADSYARQPDKIANRAYANRMGNGTEWTGDGWKYRGRGLIQLSGRSNYRKAGQAIGVNLEADPDLVADFPVALETALVYWTDRQLSRYADDDDAEMITRAINGGLNGYPDRLRLLALAKDIWPPGVAWVPPVRPPIEPDIPDDPEPPLVGQRGPEVFVPTTQPAAPAAGFFARLAAWLGLS